MRWLASSERRDAINPADLVGLASSIIEFQRRADKPVILIDGLDILVSANGFRPTMAFLDRINKMNAQRKGILLAVSSGIPNSSAAEPALWEVFEEAPLVQARVKVARTIEIGETFQFQIDLFNVGSRRISVDAIENIVPPTCKVVDALGHTIQGSSLLFGGKQLEPFQLESSIILLQGSIAGETLLNARVKYRDGKAVQSSQAVNPISLSVLQPQDIQFESKDAAEVFSYLGKEFVGDYMLRKKSASDSGWRTLLQVSESTKVPRSTLYGDHGRLGKPILELTSRGLVEDRRFADGRGRTGETVRYRVAYDRDAVRRFVDRSIARPS
jgi:hypothetical protein